MVSSSDNAEKGTDPTGVSPPDTEDSEPDGRYLAGKRLVFAVIGFGVCSFLPTAEASIISTALVTISQDLRSFDQSSWVVTAYLLTYTGFLVIWSKLAELVGVRRALLACTILFVAFSGACGAAQTMNQLIVFRALQGIGGSGMYTIPTIGLLQLVPGHRYTQMNAIAAATMALALLLGPVIGGAISETRDWRWIFYWNVPAGLVALAAVLIVLPRRFPHHCDPVVEKERLGFWSAATTLVKKVDLPGALFLLGASTLLVTALEEGGVRFAWNSPAIIIFFVLGGILSVAFFLWGWFSESIRNGGIEPMFPRSYFTNRVFMGALFGAFISGVPLIVAVIELPQRYQLVNDASPLEAGVRLLAYAASLPTGIMLANVIVGRLRVPFVYALLVSAVLQVIGFALLSTLPSTLETWPGQYGYSVIAGLGIGLSIGTIVVLAPVAVEKKDQHMAVGSALQVRLLGSAVGIAVANSLFQEHLRSSLGMILPGSDAIDRLVQSTGLVSSYPLGVQTEIRQVYGECFNIQMRATTGFCAGQLLVVVMIWRGRQLRLGKNGTLE